MQGGRYIINKSLFHVNQRIEIWLTKDIVGEFYHSRIEEVTDEYLLIAMPMSKGYPIMLTKGGAFHGKVIDNTSVYQFTSHLLERKFQPLPLWVIDKPRELKKVQLRSFVRIDAHIRVEAHVILENNNFEIIDTMSKDISGGGILVVSKQKINIDSQLKLSIDILPNDTVHCNGMVVRIEQPQLNLPVYWIAIRFTDIAENDRSKIIKSIFKKQLERRQRGYI